MIDARTRDDEVFLTGTSDGAAALLESAAAELARRGAAPISVKAYGPSAELRDAVRRSGLGEGIPVTYLEAGPGRVGLQVWAAGADVKPAGPGRLWSGRGFRALHLPAVRGEGGGPAGQAESMFERAGALLAAHGFGWRHVKRTWIYLARLLDWYGDLNRVRSGVFRRVGVDAATGYPASTGIQGRSGAGEECQMDVLAVDGLSARYIVSTPRQNEAAAYGSAFSRGVVLDRDGRRTVHVSGTASIDAAGRTIHVDDPAGQARETLACVESLLGAEGARLSDIVSATLFGRDEGVLAAARAALGRLPFPFVPVVADVCRRDLLVELEAVAAW